jgi:hypothetical protein
MSKPISNLLRKFLWRLQFTKVKFDHTTGVWIGGRCTYCAVGANSHSLNQNVECTDFRCPCSYDQYLHRKKWSWKLHEFLRKNKSC